MQSYKIASNRSQCKSNFYKPCTLTMPPQEMKQTPIVDEVHSRVKFQLGSINDLEKQLLNRSTANVDMEKKHKKSRIPDSVRKSSTMKNVANLDHILNIIGAFGFYQKFQFLLVGFLAIVPSMVAYSYVFVSATPKFTCSIIKEIDLINYDDRSNNQFNKMAIDENSDNPFGSFELEKSEYVIETKRFIRLYSTEQIRNKSIKFDNNCQIESLKSIIRLNRSVTDAKFATSSVRSNLKCAEWAYDDSMYGRTTVTDWNLICLRSHLKAVTQNAFILGTGCSLFTGILSDKFGRKTALIWMITLMVLVLNITQFFMHSAVLTSRQKFFIFTISRFMQGVAQTMYSISFVLLLEITVPKYRLLAGNILAYSFSIGQMALVGLAYYFRNWLKVQWALAVYLIPFLMYYWLVPESPRWLLSVNRVQNARHVIEKIARLNRSYERFMEKIFCGRRKSKNRVELGNDVESWTYIFALLQEEANKLSEMKKANTLRRSVSSILHSPVCVRRCFILFYTWMVILAVYLGIGMGISGNLDKFINPYAVFFMAAVCEFVGVITCHLVLDRFGRKFPLIVFLTFNAITIYLIPVYFESYPYLAIVFYFMAKYFISAAQITCMIFTSELYPTPLRSTGVGLSVAIARLGGVLAPQINVLSSTLGSIYLPFVIFSVFSLIAAIFCLFLPETLNEKLPESVKDIKALDKKY